MKVWIGNLAKYNAGILEGEWVNPAGFKKADWVDFLRTIHVGKAKNGQTFMDESGAPCEEWHICDYEDSPVHIERFESLEKLAEIANYCEQYGLDTIRAIAEVSDDTWDELTSRLDNSDYCIYEHCPNEAALGHCLVKDDYFGGVPDYLLDYIDYESLGRDYSSNAAGGFAKIGSENVYIELY